ncbi:hypothetical protein E2562_036021 [Oryza meyeriana var. granulata]|uniref:Uncharacterized protein n=1 Tax=Oryza meyeriana var. granulata TaxID=110450 RepID=A0A6G1CVZ7_9ORYZ|nr:hypothetical protein E2562_036021 [Oryza meyeriana var. granulata]
MAGRHLVVAAPWTGGTLLHGIVDEQLVGGIFDWPHHGRPTPRQWAAPRRSCRRLGVDDVATILDEAAVLRWLTQMASAPWTNSISLTWAGAGIDGASAA